MSKRVVAIFAICLMAAGAAQAQYGGGMGGGQGGGGMGGGHRGGGRRQHPSDSPPSSGAAPAPPPRSTPLSKVYITGVIRAIDPQNGRVTIAYDEVDALNWPAGTTPFVVSKPALLQGAQVGEKVRFHIESQEVTDLLPYAPQPGGDGAGAP